MDSQVEAILDAQERRERDVYRSPEGIETMMRGDFADSDTVVRLLDRHRSELLRLFSTRDLTALAALHVPTRTCDFLHVAKHTRKQVCYFHNHDCYELVYVLRGTCRQRFAHTDATLLLREGEASLLCPGAVHAIGAIDGEEAIIKIMIAPGLFEGTMAAPLQEVMTQPSSVPVAVFRGCSDTAMFCVRMLLVETAWGRDAWRTAARGWLTLLAVELARTPRISYSSIARALGDYVAADPAHVSLHGFATSIGYSDDHAGRLVREATGRSFLDCVGDAKMRIAASMLLETDLSVDAIARAVGYANRSGLHKRFRRIHGLTPDEYRRLFRI